MPSTRFSVCDERRYAHYENTLDNDIISVILAYTYERKMVRLAFLSVLLLVAVTLGEGGRRSKWKPIIVDSVCRDGADTLIDNLCVQRLKNSRTLGF